MSSDVKIGTYKGRTPRSVLWIFAGIIAALILTVLASNVATQYMAQALHYPVSLGQPLTWFDNKPFYSPHKVWVWLYLLLKSGVAPRPVIYSFLILLAGLLAGAGVIYWAWRGRAQKYWFFFNDSNSDDE